MSVHTCVVFLKPCPFPFTFELIRIGIRQTTYDRLRLLIRTKITLKKLSAFGNYLLASLESYSKILLQCGIQKATLSLKLSKYETSNEVQLHVCYKMWQTAPFCTTKPQKVGIPNEMTSTRSVLVALQFYFWLLLQV